MYGPDSCAEATERPSGPAGGIGHLDAGGVPERLWRGNSGCAGGGCGRGSAGLLMENQNFREKEKTFGWLRGKKKKRALKERGMSE